MNIEELHEYCSSIPGAEESLPFDESTVVFKIMNKMFVFFSLDPHESGFRVNLKCDPEKAIELREKYESVSPGYHTNKRLWNTINLAGDMPDDEIRYWIKHSVDEVVNKMTKKMQSEYSIIVSQATLQ